jgi:hypothetical protein
LPTTAIAGTGRIAPTKSTCGKHTIGIAIVAWDGSDTAADNRHQFPRGNGQRHIVERDGSGSGVLRQRTHLDR